MCSGRFSEEKYIPDEIHLPLSIPDRLFQIPLGKIGLPDDLQILNKNEKIL
jgi:hypothetical protein